MDPTRPPTTKQDTATIILALAGPLIDRIADVVTDRVGELLDAQPERPRYLTEAQICEQLQISRPTLRKMDPPCVMIGAHRRYDLQEVGEYLRARGAK